MNPHSSKLQHRQNQHTTEETEQQTQGREFASAEEMISFDAAQTEVPEAIQSRLADSLQNEPGTDPPAEPWWRRMFFR